MLAKAKSPLTLLVLVLMLAAAFVVGWRLATEPVPATVEVEESRKKSCRTQTLRPGDFLRLSQVTVNVYNAGTIPGLAESTLSELVERGLLPGRTGNAPADVDTQRTLLLDSKPESAAVKLVKKQLKRPVQVRKIAEDLTAGVDVIVGDKSLGLRGGSTKQVKVKAATTVCVPRPTAD
jgi:hypothetical protein